jgi:transcription elongation GreA/GreB family factor
MGMDKSFLVAQLGERLRDSLQHAHRAGVEARQDARSGAARAVNLAKAQTQRELGVKDALEALSVFKPRAIGRGERIALGAIVEVEDGESGKTLFLSPVGAGEELTGPDGDGYFQVVTPGSPFGRAVLGKKAGDVVEVWIRGELTEWTITYVA